MGYFIILATTIRKKSTMFSNPKFGPNGDILLLLGNRVNLAIQIDSVVIIITISDIWRQLLLVDYLRLVRLPNLFTVPSNIIAGYSALVIPPDVTPTQLFLLASCSILLYTSGIVFNDYFDIETDLKERSDRPLPSGRISKQTASVIAVVSMISANLIAFEVGLKSLVISASISGIVIVYDYKLKKTAGGPAAMALSRSLNIILGASPAIYLVLQNYNLLTRLSFICLSTFAYVFSISLLSRKEVEMDTDKKEGRAPQEEKRNKTMRTNRNTVLICFLIVFGIIASFIFLTFVGIFKADLFINLTLFLSIMIGVLFNQIRFGYSSSSIQYAVKYMVTGIIVFDSVFITGVAGLYYGLAVVLFVIPTVLLSRRLYIT